MSRKIEYGCSKPICLEIYKEALYNIFMTHEGKQGGHNIDALFRKTQYADHLKTNPRWSRFQPEGVEKESWRQVLHADSDGLDHARLMINLTNLFFEYDTDQSVNLDSEETELLYIAMAAQNWGKSFDDDQSVGKDISYEFLTANDINHRRRKLHQLFDTLTPELDVKRRYIVEKAIYDRETKVGEVFDAIRRLNCLRTGVIAYRNYSADPDAPEHQHLGALSLSVLSNQLTYLITYAEKFTPVSRALDEAKEDIDKIFRDRTIREHPFVAAQQTIEAIERSEMIWNRSHGDQSAVSVDRKRPKDDTLFSTESLYEKRFINNKDDLGTMVESLRTLGMKITLTSGSFDLLHVGHAKYLERASEYGDILVVGVDSDAKIKARKGPSRPIVGEEERLRLLSHIRGVDLLTLKEPDEEKWGLIKLIRPDTLIVTAETYGPEDIKELERLYCKRVIVLEPQATTSTGAQIRRIQIGEKQVLTQALEAIAQEEGVSEELKREMARVIVSLQGN